MEVDSDEDKTSNSPENTKSDQVEASKSFSAVVGGHGQGQSKTKTYYGISKSHGVTIRKIRDVTLGNVLERLAQIIPARTIIAADSIGPNYGVWVENEERVAQLIEVDTITFGSESVKINPFVNPIRKV